jgi:hypothetical protein
MRSEEGLCLITFELIFNLFHICIEQDEGGDINWVFNLMIGDLVKELESMSRDAEDIGRYDYGYAEGGYPAESEAEIRAGPARRGQVVFFHRLEPETTGVQTQMSSGRAAQ